eukprot:COSAG01_NODE_1328_length_10708_cov_102.064379_1_plen_99_part_00
MIDPIVSTRTQARPDAVTEIPPHFYSFSSSVRITGIISYLDVLFLDAPLALLVLAEELEHEVLGEGGGGAGQKARQQQRPRDVGEEDGEVGQDEGDAL